MFILFLNIKIFSIMIFSILVSAKLLGIIITCYSHLHQIFEEDVWVCVTKEEARHLTFLLSEEAIPWKQGRRLLGH